MALPTINIPEWLYKDVEPLKRIFQVEAMWHKVLGYKPTLRVEVSPEVFCDIIYHRDVQNLYQFYTSCDFKPENQAVEEGRWIKISTTIFVEVK